MVRPVAAVQRLVASDSTHALPFFALTNVFWVFAFLGADLHGWRLAVMVPDAVVAATIFTAMPFVSVRSQRDKVVWFGLYLVPVAVMGLVMHSGVLFVGCFVSVAAAVLLPLTASALVSVAAGTVMSVGAWYMSNGTLFTLGCMATFMGIAMATSLRDRRRTREMECVQQRNAVLAVAAERARIGRDLHDILGHSLTTIAVKGDLAARLVDRDPDAARAQLAELVSVARHALADTRATASGLREVRVASEIASARSVLEAAGITATTPSALPVLDDATAELFGYVVREGVTNVVRHAGATQCRISVDEQGVSVVDDGPAAPVGVRRSGGSTASSGLTGLQARATEAGWHVTLRREADHTVLACTSTLEGSPQ